MHGGDRDELPATGVGQRASDDDRERAVARLRRAAGEGLLDLDELEERLAAAYAAETLPELAPITADLPEVPAPARPQRSRTGPSALDNVGFRYHLTVYAMVIGMLVGIWLLSGGGHFWPFYPAAGWGVGLGSHWQGVRMAQLRRSRREHRRSGPSRDVGAASALTSVSSAHRPPAPVAAPPAQAAEHDPPTRRYVVALFVDVVSSTSLNEALGDERWLSVRRAYRALVETCVTAHGGWEVNSSGDGVLARFEHPQAAARAAVELLRRLEQRRTQTGFAPSVRVGIHSGDAMDEDGDLIGAVVNLAARVTDAADVDEILVTEHVADHLGAGHRTSGRGLHTLKGISRPRHLLALEWR